MSSDETNALDTALETTLPPDDTAAAEPTPAQAHDEPAASAEDAAPSPADTLSPAVRRLVRQYDLDVTGIHGTGPSGRIRVGDVIGMLGGRNEPMARSNDAVRTFSPDEDDAGNGGASSPVSAAAPAPAAATAAGALTTTVFECDLSRVLTHRKKQRRDQAERLLTSYFLLAYDEALQTVAELTSGRPACFGVHLTTADGNVRNLRLDATTLPAGSVDERLAAIDAGLRASVDADLGTANVVVHHYGASGSLLATPTPVEREHAASLGIGRVRREVVVRTVDGEETPRIAAVCHVSLSFVAGRLTLDRANRFLAHAVRVLEQWPD